MSDFKHKHGTALWFVPAAAAQAEDAIFELDTIATAAGVQSAQLDLGVRTTAYFHTYLWRAFVQLQATTPVVGKSIDFYLKLAYSSSANHIDNDDGTAAGALSSSDKLANLTYLGSIKVDEAAANIPMSKSGLISFDEQFVNIVAFNRSGATTTTDVDENGLILVPVQRSVV